MPIAGSEHGDAWREGCILMTFPPKLILIMNGMTTELPLASVTRAFEEGGSGAQHW